MDLKDEKPDNKKMQKAKKKEKKGKDKGAATGHPLEVLSKSNTSIKACFCWTLPIVHDHSCAHGTHARQIKRA